MEQYSFLINKYWKKGLLLDTKPLLLLLVGACDANRFKDINRIAGYTKDNYHLLLDLLEFFERIITTPNILTEASNLLRQAHLSHDDYLIVTEYVKSFKEEYIPSAKVVSHDHFYQFGLADIATLDCACGKYLVLTADAPLYGYLVNMNVDAINFNYMLDIGNL